MAEKKESVDTTQFRRIHKVEVKKKRFTLSKKSIAMIVVIVLIIAGCLAAPKPMAPSILGVPDSNLYGLF